jgi:flagellar protein FlgJ
MDIGSTGDTDVLVQQTQNKIAELKRAERAAKAHVAAPEAIDKAAQDFEAVFLSQMLQHMFSDIDMNPMTEEAGPGEDIYKSMLIDEYGKILTRAGGIGVADHVKREMLKVQEVGQ